MPEEFFQQFLPEERPKSARYKDFPKAVQEELDWLDEVLEEYEKYIDNIGNLGVSAALLLYYRDEVQESLDYLKREDLDLRHYWQRIVQLDGILRVKARIFINEIGFNNFKQYQIINDPPKIRWWWYLDRAFPEPRKPKKFWEIWKQ